MADTPTSDSDGPDTEDAEDILADAREAFKRAEAAEFDNRNRGLADLRFARHGEQWPGDIRKVREINGRPCLTINKMPSFIRQVVNDARQNKPEIKVKPADDNADVETAKVINGLIKQIEVSSSADIAYDTAIEGGVTNGFGYITVDTEYAYEDAFDQDIRICRVADPFTIYGDPASTSADGSDWNVAFEVTLVTKAEFEAKYKGKSKVNWDDNAWKGIGAPWLDGDSVLLARYWTREQVDKEIVLTDDGKVYDADELETDEDLKFAIEAGLMTIVKRRTTKAYKVTLRVMSGAEVLETVDWPGCYIPIVPVYGDEYFIEGKRYLQSLIYPAKDAQMAFNVMRSTSVEMFGLQPKVPFIGKKGAFDHDIDRWNTANTENHAFLEYEGDTPPQRQQMDMGPAGGAMQEALSAADDMKAILGIYDASLGARSNETSGKAIMARQREGDVSTFHFIDNMSRSVRHLGRIIIDLIPHFYNRARVIRVLGEDNSEQQVTINQPHPKLDQNGQPMMEPATGPDGQPQVGPDGNPIMKPVMAMHDLTVGKYDLIVSTGPSFTSRREESANLMMEFARAFPPAAPLLMDLVAKNMDWPGAETLTERLKNMIPQQAEGGLPPEVQKQMHDMQMQLQDAEQKITQLQSDQSAEMQKNQQAYDLQKKALEDKFTLGQLEIKQKRQLEMAANDTVETMGPDGEAMIQSATMQGLTMLGQLIAQEGDATRAALSQLAAVVSAPNQLIRDASGRAVGSQKVMN